MRKRLRTAMLLLAPALAVAGCGDNRDHAGGSDETLLVFAASSLTDAFADLDSAFELAHPGIEVQLNLAGSSALREQILDGAPADVFASANEPNMAEVVAAGEVRGRPVVFARNLLEIAVPDGNPGNVTGLDDFADRSLLIGVCAAGVPCGDLAREAFASRGVSPSIDTNEPDVRALLTKIGADELDAGIVYTTDVRAADGLVEGIDIPEAHNAPATYLIAELAGSPGSGAGEAFVDFVVSPEGRTILRSHGFASP